MNENNLNKFQGLLRTLFQFDCADLDFGIYRILNYKRGQVEAFISEHLPQIVDEAFARYAAADKAVVEQELEQTRQEIVKNLGEQAIDESGQLRNYHKTKLGQQYLMLLERRAQYQVADELKTRVYNDLFTFFSRYYEDGDFVSKRRYGRHETYAIPYNGEEVVLYWANRDQYYVKTGERFKAYRFKVAGHTVAFELRNVAPEQNGNGGKRRYFMPAHEAPLTWNEEEKALSIAFEYRPLTEAEEKEHGRTEQQKPQDSLNEAAEKKIFGLVADGNLKVALAKPEGTNGWSLLRKHLTRFTRKNTADFFIHKDLRGFLRRELDFFVKNEVLLLDELIGGREEDLREHVQRGRVVRQVAEAIIDFLAQVEDFQKKLWEKKKFVLRTEYCLTIDRVPEELWDEVLANEAQIAEWRHLYSIEGQLNKSFLEAHPTLVVDTRHFPEDPSSGSGQSFKGRLLAHFDDLDEALDGLLIKSENWQALNLLLEKYREKVKCIYIDPPYNTGSDEFIYKDRYQHSSWLSMMADRLQVAHPILDQRGAIFVSIDDHEQHNLSRLMNDVFGVENYVARIVVRSNPRGRQAERFVATVHEYLLGSAKDAAQCALQGAYLTQEQIKEFKYQDESRRSYRLLGLRQRGSASNREDRSDMFFPIYVDPTSGKVSLTPGERFCIEVLPKKSTGKEGRWMWGPSKVRENLDGVEARLISKRNEWDIFVHDYLISESGEQRTSKFKTIWDDKNLNYQNGKTELKELFGTTPYEYPKPTSLVGNVITLARVDDSLCLDFFSGSATTAHAVLNLNRQDGGRRKYILVEIGDWFETVMLPRIKKVVFCKKWKDGKPVGGNGISHLLKYEYLEQYEDTLNNLELPRAAEGQKMLELFGDEYLLKYMLDFETQGSLSVFSLDRFKDPFAYRLKVQEGDEFVERPVDLVETFNYLLGIQVRKVRAFQDNGRPYRVVLGEKNGKRVAIVWRSVVGLEDNEEALMQDRAYIEQTVLPALLGKAKPDRLLVNGACFVKDAEAIKPEFKRLMFAPVGA